MTDRLNPVQVALKACFDKGWTITALSEELEIGRETVSRWWRAETVPDHQKIVIMALEGVAQWRRVPKQRRYRQGESPASVSTRKNIPRQT